MKPLQINKFIIYKNLKGRNGRGAAKPPARAILITIIKDGCMFVILSRKTY